MRRLGEKEKMNIQTSMRHSAEPSYTGKSAVDKENTLRIRIRDFTSTPGVGLKANGPYSGEEYLEKHLLPAYREARGSNRILLVDMDGTAGYGPSFVGEAFAGLVRETKDKDI